MEPAGGSEAGAAGVPAAGEGAAAPPTTLAGAGVVKGAGLVQGRSCKGCLFYSSVLRSKGRGPVCVGITRSIPQVPDRLVGEIELGAIQEGRHLSNFKYACAGYSIYLDDKDNPPGKGEKRAQLPICVGVELLADRAPTKQAPAQAPAHLRKEGCNEVLELQCLCLKPTSRPHQKLELGTKLNEEIKKRNESTLGVLLQSQGLECGSWARHAVWPHADSQLVNSQFPGEEMNGYADVASLVIA